MYIKKVTVLYCNESVFQPVVKLMLWDDSSLSNDLYCTSVSKVECTQTNKKREIRKPKKGRENYFEHVKPVSDK